MAIYYVDAVNGKNGNDGSSERPWETITWALASVDAGDTIRVRTGVYRESVKVNKPKVWLVADVPEGSRRPVIDGGWKGEAVPDQRAGLLTIGADGVTVEGLRVENSPGRGVTIAADDVTLRNCHVRNVRMDGIVANGLNVGGLRNILIEDCSFVGLSRKMADGKSDQAAGSSFVMVHVLDSVFRGNIVGEGYKEGFNIDKNTRGCLYEGNLLFNTGHGGCYFNHSQGNVVRNNVFLHTTPERYRGGRGGFPSAVVFGDERAAENRGVDKSRDNEFSGNLVVGWGRMVEVRNNAKDPGGYDTQLLNTVIRNNTFIAGPETTAGIAIAANLYGRPHQNSGFIGNVVYLTGAKAGADIGTMGAGGGVAFKHNAWSVQPPRTMQGEGDLYGEPGLTNPGAALVELEDAPFIEWSRDNYRPAAGSVLATEGIGALPPLVVEEPDPPEPDYEWLLVEVAAMREKVGEAGRALVWTDLKLEELEKKLEVLR